MATDPRRPIRLSGHAHQQLGFRGATEAEVVDAIRTTSWQPAELGQLECRKQCSYNDMWNGIWYAIRQVRPIFVEEEKEIVVVTVYVYFF